MKFLAASAILVVATLTASPLQAFTIPYSSTTSRVVSSSSTSLYYEDGYAPLMDGYGQVAYTVSNKKKNNRQPNKKKWHPEDDFEKETEVSRRAKVIEIDDDPQKMRVKDIKAELDMGNVKYNDCFEKDHLVKRLIDARANPGRWRDTAFEIDDDDDDDEIFDTPFDAASSTESNNAMNNPNDLHSSNRNRFHNTDVFWGSESHGKGTTTTNYKGIMLESVPEDYYEEKEEKEAERRYQQQLQNNRNNRNDDTAFYMGIRVESADASSHKKHQHGLSSKKKMAAPQQPQRTKRRRSSPLEDYYSHKTTIRPSQREDPAFMNSPTQFYSMDTGTKPGQKKGGGKVNGVFEDAFSSFDEYSNAKKGDMFDNPARSFGDARSSFVDNNNKASFKKNKNPNKWTGVGPARSSYEGLWDGYAGGSFSDDESGEMSSDGIL